MNFLIYAVIGVIVLLSALFIKRTDTSTSVDSERPDVVKAEQGSKIRRIYGSAFITDADEVLSQLNYDPVPIKVSGSKK